jgi:hypothetical protein
VADDELAPAFEEVEQGGAAGGAFELVVLRDLDHRQLATPRVQRITRLGHRLLVGQQLDSRGAPLFW